MGSVTQRKLASGTVRFRAEIRIKRKDHPEYKESKTFGTKKTAENWIKKRELEIEENPNILHGQESSKSMTIGVAIKKYLEEVGGQYSRTKIRSLDLLSRLPISKVSLDQLNASHISSHVSQRRSGIDKMGLDAIEPSTILNELQNLKSVLTHARLLWRCEVNIVEFNDACMQLRKTRQLKKANKRDRLLTSTELKQLLEHYLDKWNRGRTAYPMHLIIIFAIFSCRRQAEITRIALSDYNKDHQVWTVRDLKDPSGKGKHKDFTVGDECQFIINILLSDTVRNRMLKMSSDDGLLVPLSPVAIASEFNQSCKIIGINDLRFHDLRHEGATRLAEKGLSIPQIQQVTLHDTWSSLERYVSVKQRRDVMTFDEMLQIIDEM